MSKKEKTLFMIYLPLTVFILVLQTLYHKAGLVNYIKFATILSLFIAALFTQKQYFYQKLLNLSLLFICIADFFLVICSNAPSFAFQSVAFGMLGFILAYITLIIVFQKNFRIGWPGVLVAFPLLTLFIINFTIISANLKGPIFYAVLIFGLILCYTGWTLINTLFRGYFSLAGSYRIALAGILIYICDMGVGNAIFNPNFAGHFVPWLQNIIWAAYIPGWTIIRALIAEKNLLKTEKSD